MKIPKKKCGYKLSPALYQCLDSAVLTPAHSIKPHLILHQILKDGSKTSFFPPVGLEDQEYTYKRYSNKTVTALKQKKLKLLLLLILLFWFCWFKLCLKSA
jgi:hypothetical protein